jgi:LPS export ABC transporter protein LptC
MVNRSILGMVLAFVLLVSCSAEQGTKTYEQIEAQPDIQLSNATYILGRDKESPITVQASSISIYLKTDQALLEGITFEQKDSKGTVDLIGSALKATVNTKTYDAQLQGTIKISKLGEDFAIEAETLSWENDSQLLQSDKDSAVYISFDEGNTLTGNGFSGNLKEGTYEYSSIEKGVLKK